MLLTLERMQECKNRDDGRLDFDLLYLASVVYWLFSKVLFLEGNYKLVIWHFWVTICILLELFENREHENW